MKADLDLEKIKQALREALDALPPDGKPDALLFTESEDWDEDHAEINFPERIWGLPVFYCSRVSFRYTHWANQGVPWIPVWRKKKKEPSLEDIENFSAAYLKHLYN